MIDYEWDCETIGKHGDILEHQHADTLAGVRRYAAGPRDAGTTAAIVLVRDVVDGDGVADRLWAYMRPDGSLPDVFADSLMQPTSVRVPKRFHVEARRFAPSMKEA